MKVADRGPFYMSQRQDYQVNQFFGRSTDNFGISTDNFVSTNFTFHNNIIQRNAMETFRTNQRVTSALYAGDIPLISSERIIKYCTNGIKQHLPALYDRQRLLINRNKYETICQYSKNFSRKRSRSTATQLIGKVPSSVGIKFDSRLTWRAQIEHFRPKTLGYFVKLRFSQDLHHQVKNLQSHNPQTNDDSNESNKSSLALFLV